MFLGIMIYFGFKEPPKQVIDEVKKTNPQVNKEVGNMLHDENNFVTPTNGMPTKDIQVMKDIDNTDMSTIPDVTNADSVSEIVKKNERIRDLIYTYQDFQLNYLRYRQVTSGEKFPDKGKFLKDAYEKSLEKLFTFNTEDDYKLLIDFAISREWRPIVKQYFFNRLSEVQNNFKDTVIIDKLDSIKEEESILLLLKGLSRKLSPENKERIINAFTKVPQNYDKVKKELQDIINKQ